MQIHQNVSMLPEDGSYESLRQDICTLFVGRNVLDRNYTERNQLPNEVETHINVFRPRKAKRVGL